MSEVEKTYYLTKYALTEGIKEVACARPPSGYGYLHPENNLMAYKAGRDIFESKADALKRAEAMRIKKIASLRKQIAKLEKLSFGEGA